MVKVARYVVVSTLFLAVATLARADVSGPDIVRFMNDQRAGNGIPGDIVEDPALSDGCAKHDAYLATNQLPPQHFENQGDPGYTPEGDAAAKNSVLYQGNGPWTATSDPFETAPIHLHQLLAPRIDRAGAAEAGGYGCFQTHASENRLAPAQDVTYTYPSDGQTGWRASEVAQEGPYTPGQQVGIPQDAETGPYLYVMFDGPDLTPFDTASATGAALNGPKGAVDVAIVDNNTQGLTGYLPTGMEVIPRQPLAPHTTYTATVSANVTTHGGSGSARPFSHTWSFTTGDLPNSIAIARVTTNRRALAVGVQSTAPGAVVFAGDAGPTTSAPVGADGVAHLTLSADGDWRVCALSGGGTTGYAAASDCTHVTVVTPFASTQAPSTVSAPARLGQLGYSRHGRRVTVYWYAVARAARYRVKVSSGGRARTLVTARTRIHFTLPLLRGARVTVRGVNPAGVVGPRSPVRKIARGA